MKMKGKMIVKERKGEVKKGNERWNERLEGR